jgi:alkanesulfonate monooxygenase SsuD/methylene tetrahydromethanopterin reductase-like flavin-dependent oxidoreductase (luciferase family)
MSASASPALSSPNRLKLGLFCTNLVSAMTTAPELFQTTWPNVLAVAREAEAIGLEALVPVARWKGYVKDDVSHRSHEVLDPYVYAAAVAQATEFPSVFATTHAPTAHPLVVAKQCATIDHVSGGRFVLNVVGGWNRPEFEMFGIEMLEHGERYAYLEEWLGLVRRLWTEGDEFDYESANFSLRRALSRPQPLQEGGIPIMNAGISDRGRAFSAQHSDIGLVQLAGADPTAWAQKVRDFKRLPRTGERGRELQVWTNVSIIVRDSDDEAEAYAHRVGVELFDEASATGFMATQVKENPNIAGPVYESLRDSLRTPGPGLPFTGSPETVVAGLRQLSDAGVDGAIVSYVDYLPELGRLRTDLLPLLEEAGLRQPHRA